MKSRVFIAQPGFVGKGKSRKPMDMSKAHRYGEVVTLLSEGQWAAMGNDALFDEIWKRLAAEEFMPEQDYLIATGDMVVGVQIAACMMSIGGCRMLRWDNREGDYFVYEVKTP